MAVLVRSETMSEARESFVWFAVILRSIILVSSIFLKNDGELKSIINRFSRTPDSNVRQRVLFEN